MIAAQPHALALHRMSAAILPEPSRFPQLGPVHTVAKRVHPPGRVDYSVSTHIHESKKYYRKKFNLSLRSFRSIKPYLLCTNLGV
jgi:hypothetical protein